MHDAPFPQPPIKASRLIQRIIPTKPLSPAEFIALIAMLFATVAFSVDSMLPALPQIGAEFSSDHPNRAQLIVASFVFGLGIGTLFAGPLSDSFGRKTVILAGGGLYITGAALAMLAPSLEMIFAARVLQGLGASAPRIAALALVRDLHKGRAMARIVSIAMTIFTLVPALAPLMGQGIIAVFGWRGIFAAFIAFSVISLVWLGLRQPETLPATARLPFRLSALRQAFAEVLSHRTIRLSIMAQTCAFGSLVATISSVQPIFETGFNRAETFPLYFGAIALTSGLSSLANAAHCAFTCGRPDAATDRADLVESMGGIDLMDVIRVDSSAPRAAQSAQRPRAATRKAARERAEA